MPTSLYLDNATLLIPTAKPDLRVVVLRDIQSLDMAVSLADLKEAEPWVRFFEREAAAVLFARPYLQNKLGPLREDDSCGVRTHALTAPEASALDHSAKLSMLAPSSR